MSLCKWLKSSSKDHDQTEERAIKAAEKAVKDLVGSMKGKKRKSSERHYYDQGTKTAIGKYATING